MFPFWYEHRELLSAIVRSNMTGLTLEQFMETGYAERLGKRLVNLPELEDDSKMFRMTTFFTTSGLFVILLDWLRRIAEGDGGHDGAAPHKAAVPRASVNVQNGGGNFVAGCHICGTLSLFAEVAGRYNKRKSRALHGGFCLQRSAERWRNK